VAARRDNAIGLDEPAKKWKEKRRETISAPFHNSGVMGEYLELEVAS